MVAANDTRASETSAGTETEPAQSYLLVYHARSGLPGERLLDKSNDPELRVMPMTWGICRTNVRKWVHPGADLFFLAYPDGARERPLHDRYYLSARFHVAERIDHDVAVRRFPGRPNVILDYLPPGSSLPERLHAYLAAHITQLVWAERDQVVGEMKTGSGDLFDHPDRSAIQLHGEWYVHAYWDHHLDWRRRLAAPYIVADRVESKLLKVPIPYMDCARMRCASGARGSAITACLAARRAASQARGYRISSRSRSV